MKNLPDQLIDPNCPSIEYRTRKEILNENLSDHEVKSPFRKNFDLVDDMHLEQIAENIKRTNQRTAYTGWGAYSGLALNSDWKSKQNRISDLAFRICLTQHYGDNWIVSI